MEKIKFAVVGAGNIGKKHIAHITANAETTLVAVCDIDVAKKMNVPEGIAFFPGLTQMLDQEDFDILCICTPNYLHATQAIEALEHQKHVVIEKPMALNVPDCDQIIAAAAKNGKRVFTVMQNRYSQAAQLAKKLIDTNRLGKIFILQFNCFWNRSAAYYAQSNWRGNKKMDGGVLFTQFSHFIDMLYYLHGGMTAYKGFVHNYDHPYTTIEDSGSIVMQSQKGAIVNFNFSTCAYEKNMESAVTIIAEKGTIKIGGQYLNSLDYQSIQGEPLPEIHITNKANDYGFYKGSMNNHDKVIQNVVDVLLHGGVAMSDAQDGKAVVEMIQNIYANTSEIF